MRNRLINLLVPVVFLLGLPQEVTGQAITFTDVAASMGVADAGAGRGVAWGDYDGDGDLDLYTVNSSQPNRLFQNRGTSLGSDLAVPAGIADNGPGFGVAWADYNNDGKLDLYLVRSGQANRLYRNNGGGLFSEIGSAAGVANSGAGRSVAWGDYNRDGLIDLYVVNDGVSALYRNNGDATFADAGAAAGIAHNGHAQSAAWGDYDNDGDLDLYLVIGRGGLGVSSAPDRLFRNNGNGTFTEASSLAGISEDGDGRGVAWADYDNDGDLDLYVSNSDETFGVVDAPNWLFRNNGNGTFAEVGNVAGVRDTDGDGRSVAWADYDNDGDLDLYLANDGADRLYQNNGNGTFTNVAVTTDVTDNSNSVGAAWGDYDGDGYVDLYVSNDAGPNRLYHNNGSNGRWLSATLVGSASNRAGIGTQVTAFTGSKRQRRDVDGASGYLSQPSLPVEFGFGTTATVDSLVIIWPSGGRQTVTNVSTNQKIIVTESVLAPDTEAPRITLSGSTHAASVGQSYTVNATLTDNRDIQTATLFYREAGAPNWSNSGSMSAIGSGLYSGTIPAAKITQKGSLFIVRATDPSGNTRESAIQGLTTTITNLQSSGLSLPSGGHLKAKDFRMISIPAILDNRNPVAVLSPNFNTGTPDQYDSNIWRLFRWNGSDYTEYPSAGQLDPGKAFWVVARKPSEISIPTATTASNVQRSLLLAPGWNQVGNPYLFPVAVSAILDGTPPGLVDQAFWHWDGQEYRPATTLEPWQGYWVKNLTSGTVDLPIPRLDATLASPKQIVATLFGTPTGSDWRLKLRASSGQLGDGSAYVGIHPFSVDGWDPHDLSKPPSIGEDGLSLSFSHPDWTLHPGKYATDVRPSGKDGYTWTFEVETGQPGVPVTLTVSGVDALPADLVLILIDTDQNTRHYLRHQPSFTFLPTGKADIRHFTLIVGSASYVEATKNTVVPTVVSLEQNQPNPFNPSTEIRFNLPAAASVTLKIYNSIGQEVRLLAEGLWPAGQHVVPWDGANAQGRQVASGVYLYQLRTGAFVQTRKMVFLR